MFLGEKDNSDECDTKNKQKKKKKKKKKKKLPEKTCSLRL